MNITIIFDYPFYEKSFKQKLLKDFETVNLYCIDSGIKIECINENTGKKATFNEWLAMLPNKTLDEFLYIECTDSQLDYFCKDDFDKIKTIKDRFITKQDLYELGII